MRLAFPLLLAVLAGPNVGLAAESDPLHLTGSRVRLFASDSGTEAGRLSSRGLKHTGTVIEMRSDTLVITAEAQSNPSFVPAASLTSLEVSRGTHSHILAGAALGLLAGAVVGGVITRENATNNEERGLEILFGTLLGGGAGLVGGAVIGSRLRTERWEALRLPINIGLRPSADTFALSVKVPLR